MGYFLLADMTAYRLNLLSWISNAICNCVDDIYKASTFIFMVDAECAFELCLSIVRTKKCCVGFAREKGTHLTSGKIQTLEFARGRQL